jgi:quinol monooxygenase YgiN
MIHDCCTVVERRQYMLHPGQRDTLIDLFERHLIEAQEDVGMHIIGQFRDLDDPDRFVWLRGFQSMRRRRHGLEAFYGGPVWARHRKTANATIIDSDNVLLLDPILLAPANSERSTRRTGPAGREQPQSIIQAVTLPCRHNTSREALISMLHDHIRPTLTALGAAPLACFTTLHEPNDFPILPVRDSDVLVWLTRFPDHQAFDHHQSLAAQSTDWAALIENLQSMSTGPLEILRLQPTTRSEIQ